MTQKELNNEAALEAYGLYRVLSIHRKKEIAEELTKDALVISFEQLDERLKLGQKIYETIEREARTPDGISSYPELLEQYKIIKKAERAGSLTISTPTESASKTPSKKTPDRQRNQ